MWYSHELGQSWPTKYGVVGGVEVGDVEVDVLDTVVVVVPNCTGRVISPSGLDALPGTTP